MTSLASIGFTTPWLLWAAVALPAIWLLLRVIPPAPVLRRFPGVVLLLGLSDSDSASSRTPLWMILLRMSALALAILGFSGPVLNPEPLEGGKGPLLLLADASWADALDWERKRARLVSAFDQAHQDGRPVAFVDLDLAAPAEVVFETDTGLRAQLAALQPRPWEPGSVSQKAWEAALPDGGFESLWLSDGLHRAGRDGLLDALLGHGAVSVVESEGDIFGLRPVTIDDGAVTSTILRTDAAAPAHVDVLAFGLDPTGIERELVRQRIDFEAGDMEAVASIDIANELRNRLTRLEIANQRSAGAVTLTGDALKRRKVALIDTSPPREGLELLSPSHFLRESLRPSADLIEGQISDMLPASPEVVILADPSRLPSAEATALKDWVMAGGLLVRFAGPHLAAAIGTDGITDDPLLPVPLRPGGRSAGGTMSWGTPQTIAAFDENSPFHGLSVPADVAVATQVLAEPGPDLQAHTIASLTDGTPLVTRADLGKGQVVMFNVTANAEWSNLPLSGLFMQMLDRLAVTSTPLGSDAALLSGLDWVPERVIDAFGTLAPADSLAEPMSGVPGEKLARAQPSAEMPPGLYRSGSRQVALNTVTADRNLVRATWPGVVRVERSSQPPAQPLKGYLIALAMLIAVLDVLATILVSGRWVWRRSGMATMLLVLVLLVPAAKGMAEETVSEEKLIEAANGMVLAHVLTGDQSVDDLADAGLAGLSLILTQRTSVEPSPPVGVDLDKDTLSVYAMLYWPITLSQKAPSPEAYQRLNRFLQTGGMILFDTRDGDIAADGSSTPEAQRLQELAAPLDIPPLEIMPKDHVLSRSFYLLQDFPGRFYESPLWVEAIPADTEKSEGVPFRNSNDSVTPVVIGGNDWAAAWAIDDAGRPLLPVGRGAAGERQREMAYRFGVNLIMHVLTGNYKSDQVHVPALLERLGQ